MVAICSTCDEIPGEDGCGIYAVKSESQVSRTFFASNYATAAIIVGRIEMKGLVIEHELGYRAERARIVDLWVPSRLAPTIQQLYPDARVHVEGSPDG
ncbi:hypothetical protein BH23ACT4_BH23ACT4_15580 [soil metagenome]